MLSLKNNNYIFKAALSYAELGSLIDESGSEFIYIYKGFSSLNPEVGKIVSFVHIWSVALISSPAGLAAISLACAEYILSPIVGKCALSPFLTKTTALLVMCKS
jgi:L-type amino acid transporter 9